MENNVPKVIVHKKQESKKNKKNESKESKESKDNVTDVITVIEEIKDIDNDDIQDLYDIPPAPDILELNDNEKFVDVNNNVLNIEVRGERNHNKCYFKVKDVSDGFELPNLNSSLLHKTDNKFMIDIHYKYFTIIKMGKPHNEYSKKELYLTYNGILKVLFCSRTGNAENFQKWATETFFTAQMGSEEQKDILASSLLGVSSRAIKCFLTNSASVIINYMIIYN